MPYLVCLEGLALGISCGCMQCLPKLLDPSMHEASGTPSLPSSHLHVYMKYLAIWSGWCAGQSHLLLQPIALLSSQRAAAPYFAIASTSSVEVLPVAFLDLADPGTCRILAF